MILVDANLLLYARDSSSDHHPRANAWLTDALNGSARVGLPWSCLTAFLRIATHPRVFGDPLSGRQAWRQVQEWLDAPSAWIPMQTDRHPQVLGELVGRYELRGNLIPDAVLVALAIKHGLEVCSADTDFARFKEVRWRNPLGAET